MTNSVRVTGICGACGRKHELLCTLALRHVQFECKGCGVRNETPVPSTSESVHRGTSPTDWRCRCTLKRTVDKRDFMAGFICAGGDADEARKHADEYAVAVGASSADNDGPGGEDGPWAPGWGRRSGDVPGWVRDEVNRATRQYRHNTDNSPDILTPEQGFVTAYDPQVIDALIRRLLAGGPLDPKEYTPVHNSVLRFLWGTAPYAGLWFHEAENGASPYWWRKYLPKPEGGGDG